MIDVTEEQRHRQPLHRRPTPRRSRRRIAGLDDFELIAFLAVVEPADGRMTRLLYRGQQHAKFGRDRPEDQDLRTRHRPRAAREVRRRGPAHHLGLQARAGDHQSPCPAARRPRDPGLPDRLKGDGCQRGRPRAPSTRPCQTPIIFEITRETADEAVRMTAAHKRPS